ncbi:MAG TPA: MFS transporter [Conexibacter sp.]
MRTLSRRTNFWIAGAVAALALWTSVAPTVSYPLYAAHWGLTPTATTVVFAVYPVILVGVLVFFGDLSDHIGRRKSILAGLVSMLVGVLFFTFAENVWWLYIGRAFMGIGVGLSLSPASAAMVEFAPDSLKRRASSLTASVAAVGIVAATLLGGALVQYAPLPLHLDYAVLDATIAAVAVAAWFLPRHTAAETSSRWRPHAALVVPPGQRRVFATAAVALISSFAVAAVVVGLGSDISRQLGGSDNAFVTGALLSLFGFASAAAANVFAKASGRTVVAVGSGFSLVGVGLFVLVGASHSLALFLIATIVCGVGFSLNFLGGITLVTAHAAAHHRAGMLSAAYLCAYLLQGIIAVALGVIATNIDLVSAVDYGAIALSAIFVVALVLAWRMDRGGGRPARSARPAVAAAAARR